MIVLDANILLYAYDDRSVHHEPVRAWLQEQLRARESIGLPWVSLWAFLRISTNRRITRSPLTIQEACAVVREVLSIPRAVVLQPGTQHVEILERVAAGGQAGGPRLADAILAALAIEHGARLASTDADFSRFTGLKWVNPLD